MYKPIKHEKEVLQDFQCDKLTLNIDICHFSRIISCANTTKHKEHNLTKVEVNQGTQKIINKSTIDVL